MDKAEKSLKQAPGSQVGSGSVEGAELWERSARRDRLMARGSCV